jgi:hypothetical protein
MMQVPTPSDAEAWADTIERGGVVLLLFLGFVTFVAAIVRRWFAPWYVVEMKDQRIAQLEAREEQLLELALRGTSAAEAATTVMKQRR